MAPVLLCSHCAKLVKDGDPFEILVKDEKFGRRYFRLCRTCSQGRPFADLVNDGWNLWGGGRRPGGPYVSAPVPKLPS